MHVTTVGSEKRKRVNKTLQLLSKLYYLEPEDRELIRTAIEVYEEVKKEGKAQ